MMPIAPAQSTPRERTVRDRVQLALRVARIAEQFPQPEKRDETPTFTLMVSRSLARDVDHTLGVVAAQYGFDVLAERPYGWRASYLSNASASPVESSPVLTKT